MEITVRDIKVFCVFAIPCSRVFSVLMPTGHCAEKAMAPHSSTLAWKIPWTEETGRLQSIGSLGVGYN